MRDWTSRKTIPAAEAIVIASRFVSDVVQLEKHSKSVDGALFTISFANVVAAECTMCRFNSVFGNRNLWIGKRRSAQAHEYVQHLGISPSRTSNCRFTDLNNTAAMIGGNAFRICFLMSVLLAQVANW